MKRRDAMKHILTAAAAPLLGSCGVDRLFRPDFGTTETGSITLIGAGDHHATSRLAVQTRTGALVKRVLDADPAAWAFAVGDLTHSGTTVEHQYYDKTWGAFRERTIFGIGNHDVMYTDPPGAAYYAYTQAPRYYAQDIGTSWRCYVLNCGSTSQGGASPATQTAWLKNDLAQHPDKQIMAMVHYPMFASVCELHKKDMTWPRRIGPWWKVLQEHGAGFVLSGHAHRWERLRQKLADGTVSADGIRQFVVGTAGVKLRGILSRHPDSEKVVVAHGVVRFDLYPDRYEWTFTDEFGAARDQGSQLCRKVLA